METAAKPGAARSTDRVLEALSTLSALLDRTIKEVKSLDEEFQNRVLQAVHETEASIQSQAAQHLDAALTETRTKLEDQFSRKVAELTAEWEQERNRMSSELGTLTQNAAQFEAERSRLQSDMERLKRLQAATQAEAEAAMMAAKAAATAARSTKTTPSVSEELLTSEIKRVEGLIQKISDLIEDPATELSIVIRKNVERAELEAYLKGIRYALSGVSPQK
jgi:chromosome segregation ATPase